MKKDKEHIGICRICKKEKALTYEHIPPRAAFNKNTRFVEMTSEEYCKRNDIFNAKPKGSILQGGLGRYCLCKDCNNFLGTNYVNPYIQWSKYGMFLLKKEKFDYVDCTLREINPLKILKQIISIFICINDPGYTNDFPELLEFVRNPQTTGLLGEYCVYAYLNQVGQFRQIPLAQCSKYGLVSEFTYPPFGYVLSYENNNSLAGLALTEITHFSNYTDSNENKINLTLFKHPTYAPLPLDYRDKETIERVIEENSI